MDTADESPVTTKRHVLAQVVICKGCCCGQTNKGHAAIPEERLKSIWKKDHLLKTIQLTISGCVGPCDAANVVQIITPGGVEWYGNLNQSVYFDALIEWGRACSSAGKLLPRPIVLNTRRFSGYL
jgi:hypothetical protein